MKTPSLLKFLVVLWLAGLARSLTVQAADFDLLVTASPSPVVINQQLTFTIDVTNRTGFTVTNVVVTNIFPASAQLTYASNFFGVMLTNSGLLVFGIDFITNAQRARVEFGIAPAVLGDLTNTTTVSEFAFTNATTTNVVTRVVSGSADLAAGITGPAAGALVNDWIAYSVSATNFGPDAVPNVLLTNRLPPDLKLISPTNTIIPFTNGNLVFSAGNLPANTFVTFGVRVQPTNAGNMTLVAEIGATGVFDTNAANNIVTNVFSVGSFLTGQLEASISSTQNYNPQTGLMEQLITLTNAGTTNAVSARVIVQGMTNRLYNAVGTNDGHPFVTYATNLAAAASVDLLLEYFVPARVAVSNPTLDAVEVPVFTPPVPSGTAVHISRLIMLPSGRVLLEFPAEANRTYTVLYCADATFSNQTLVALPPTVAPADRVQWIDYGPPKTISHPATTPSRFYRVIVNP